MHVAGAVSRPGVVELEPGARVFQAIEAAGGVEVTADLDRINLAAIVADGERLWVPVEGEETQPSLIARQQPPAASTVLASGAFFEAIPAPTSKPIDINRASLGDLETLPGIGPALAQAIVTTRLERGPFFSVDELVEVAGIGVATLERLRPLVVTEPPDAPG